MLRLRRPSAGATPRPVSSLTRRRLNPTSLRSSPRRRAPPQRSRRFFFNYAFSGLKVPYAPPPTSFQQNRVIPIVWQYTGSNGQVTDSAGANPTVNIYGPVNCGSTTSAPITVDSVGQTGYRYDPTTQTWQFRWQASVEPACYTIQVTSDLAQPSPLFAISIK